MNEEVSVTDKCIVLDMDETLVHSFERHLEKNEINIEDPANFDIRERLYYFDYGRGTRRKIIGIKRKFLDEFIEFCSWYFRLVIIWSAGEDSYVKRTCKWIFRNYKSPYVILTREKCSGDELSKPLRFLIENKNIKNLRYENTFIVDDKESTFILENPENAIHIPAFTMSTLTPENIRSDSDNYLLDLMIWFQRKEVVKSKDVRLLDKSSIFT
jgi:TFIIF-interacting CTD phosphatase-like protein